MGESEMLFNFFKNVKKNADEHAAQTDLRSKPLQSSSYNDIRQKNIEQLRQNAVAPKPTVVQSHYDTPRSNPTFPNSRTREETGIPHSANPVSEAHAGIPHSPLLKEEKTTKVDLGTFFKYGTFRK